MLFFLLLQIIVIQKKSDSLRGVNSSAKKISHLHRLGRSDILKEKPGRE